MAGSCALNARLHIRELQASSVPGARTAGALSLSLFFIDTSTNFLRALQVKGDMISVTYSKT